MSSRSLTSEQQAACDAAVSAALAAMQRRVDRQNTRATRPKAPRRPGTSAAVTQAYHPCAGPQCPRQGHLQCTDGAWYCCIGCQLRASGFPAAETPHLPHCDRAAADQQRSQGFNRYTD
jgi:hypothetical protein